MYYRIRCQWRGLLLSLVMTAVTSADLVQAWRGHEVLSANDVRSVAFDVRNATNATVQAWFAQWQRLVANAKQQFHQSVLRKRFGGLQMHDWNEISVQWPISHAEWPTRNDKTTVDREANRLLINLMKIMLLLDFALIVGVVVMMR